MPGSRLGFMTHIGVPGSRVSRHAPNCGANRAQNGLLQRTGARKMH
jgi:hypothetical protein